MDIGFIGLGIMGRGLVRNLLAAGHSLVAWNRSSLALPPEITDNQRFRRADSIAEAVREKPVAFVCLTGPDAQRAVYPDLLSSLAKGTLVIDCTTTDPALTVELAGKVGAAGGRYLDAPMFGSKNEAWAGELDIVVGGEESDFNEAKPLLERLSKTLHYMGMTPAGVHMKLVGNLLVAAQVHSVGEAMSLARKVKLPTDRIVDVLKVVDYSSGVVVGTASASLAGNYEPSFYLKHMLKDTRLIGALARSQGVPVPGAALIAEQFQAAVNEGLGDLNASGIHKMQFRQAGLKEL